MLKLGCVVGIVVVGVEVGEDWFYVGVVSSVILSMDVGRIRWEVWCVVVW